MFHKAPGTHQCLNKQVRLLTLSLDYIVVSFGFGNAPVLPQEV